MRDGDSTWHRRAGSGRAGSGRAGSGRAGSGLAQSGLTRRRYVAALVPALNEEITVGAVVGVLARSEWIDEVIVISDGSVDRTPERAWAAGADVVVEFVRSQGKGRALRAGAAQTPARVLVMLDADLVGLTEAHVAQLVRPVLDGEADMNTGLFDRGPATGALAAQLPNLSGQRAMRRRVFDAVPEALAEGFKIETGLNGQCEAPAEPAAPVPRCATTRLTDLDFRRKWQKYGLIGSLTRYRDMYQEVREAHHQIRGAREAP